MRLGSRAWRSMRYRTAGDRGRVLGEGEEGSEGREGEEEGGIMCGGRDCTHMYTGTTIYIVYVYSIIMYRICILLYM